MKEKAKWCVDFPVATPCIKKKLPWMNWSNVLVYFHTNIFYFDYKIILKNLS
jgi:hypothetical protein